MLRALNRLLRPGGRLAFTTISVAPGLPPAARRRAHRLGPRAVAARSSPSGMLAGAGFEDVAEVDVTPAFRDTAAAWVREIERHAAVLGPLEPPGVLEQRQAERRALVAAVDDGLLRRSLLSARRPLRARRAGTAGMAAAGRHTLRR